MKCLQYLILSSLVEVGFNVTVLAAAWVVICDISIEGGKWEIAPLMSRREQAAPCQSEILWSKYSIKVIFGLLLAGN